MDARLFRRIPNTLGTTRLNMLSNVIVPVVVRLPDGGLAVVEVKGEIPTSREQELDYLRTVENASFRANAKVPPEALKLAAAYSETRNTKTGKVAATYASMGSCPLTCPFIDKGCYGKTGRVSKHLRDYFGDGSPFEIAQAEALAIRAMQVKVGLPIRLHIVGDCSSDQMARMVSDAVATWYIGRGGGPAWTYTHAWRDVSRESWGVVNVLASCETLEEVKQANMRGYRSCALVVSTIAATPRGVITCPHAVDVAAKVPENQLTHCDQCRLCVDAPKKGTRVIGLPAHGPTRQVRRVLVRKGGV